VRAQDELAGRIAAEGVLHVARGVVARDVQRLEVVPVELDLGTVEHLEAHGGEQVLEFAHDLGDRMQRAAFDARRAHGGIEALDAARGGERGVLQLALARLDGGLELGLDAVGGLSGALALRGRQRRDRGQQVGHYAALLKRGARDGAQVLDGRGRGDLRLEPGERARVFGGQVGHGVLPVSAAGAALRSMVGNKCLRRNSSRGPRSASRGRPRSPSCLGVLQPVGKGLACWIEPCLRDRACVRNLAPHAKSSPACDI
jgi:hypothetical protein